MNTFENPSNTPSNTEDLMKSAERAEKMLIAGRNKNINETKKIKYYNLFKNYFEESGAIEYSEWQSKLRKIQKQNGKIIIRRESPEKIFDLLKNKNSLKIISSDTLSNQPNVAELGESLSGLASTATGHGTIGQGSAVITVGFNPTESLKLSSLPQDKSLNFQGEARNLVKIAEGFVPFEDIKFILLRMPYSFFPEDMMTEHEIDKPRAHIQRIFVLE